MFEDVLIEVTLRPDEGLVVTETFVEAADVNWVIRVNSSKSL